MIELTMMALDGKRAQFESAAIILPTSDGQRTILDKHMPLALEVATGVVKIKTAQGFTQCFVSSGFLYFKDSQAQLFVGAFEVEGELDVKRATKAYSRAKKTLSESDDILELQKAEQALKRALGRMQVK